MFGHATYLVFELAWSLPVLLLQWAAGYRALARHRRVWALSCLLPTLYLCAADAWAISRGIWQINPARTLGLHPLGLPVEEAIFFLLTNAMIVQTLVLVCNPDDVALFVLLRRRWRRA
jgi:lycopene cyclase domain-containing protein